MKSNTFLLASGDVPGAGYLAEIWIFGLAVTFIIGLPALIIYLWIRRKKENRWYR